MAPEPISTVCFINPSRQSVCLYRYPLTLLDSSSVEPLPRQRILAQHWKNFGRVVLYAMRIELKEGRLLVSPVTCCVSLLLSKAVLAILWMTG
jgi:hypothetical protein